MAHSLALGSMLCMMLGWRGWFTCVLYLFLESFVTKVKFEEKKELGIEEKREGKCGPENAWCVLHLSFGLSNFVLKGISIDGIDMCIVC